MKYLWITLSFFASSAALAANLPCLRQAENAAIELYKSSASSASIAAGIEAKARLEDTYDEYSDYIVGVASKATSGDWEARYIVTVQSHDGQCEIVYSDKIQSR